VLSGTEATNSWLADDARESPPRAALLAAVERLLAVTAGLLADGGRRDLLEARRRVCEDRFNLVMLGEFKRGKSTLINALLDRDLVPTGVVPLTSVVTVIGAGPTDRLVVRYADGHELERPVEELGEYVTEARNPGNRLSVELARVELDHELLRGGLELVDTPGIGSIHSQNTEVARKFLPRVDAAVCVLDAGQPLSEAERQLFVDAARRVPQLLTVINKIDHLDEADREVMVKFVRSALRDLLGPNSAELYAVSARRGDGVPLLRTRLSALAADERESLLLRSVAGLCRGAAREGAQAARFEAQTIQLPLDELASRAQGFELGVADLMVASAEAGELLQRGTDHALAQLVNEPLHEHARRQDASLRAALRQEAIELGDCSPRELSAALERWIEEAVREAFAELAERFEAAIADELTQLEDRYAARVQEILEQVQTVAEDVFGARAGAGLPATGLRAPSRFSFKLHDVENALDMIVGFGRTLAPGALGRKLVVRDAEQRLVDMTDRHAGRLRSELAHRVDQAARDYRRDLARTVSDAVDAIRGAVDRATEDRRQGERRANARLQELARIDSECDQLARSMDRWLPDQKPLRETELG
jgi:GTP-binding protein EngB required for normal cell division